MTRTMRAVVVERFGAPEEALRIAEVDVPSPGPGEVLVHVHAAGLNPVDAKIFGGGATAERFGVTPPFVNGNDYAGVVEAVGEGVEGWRPGDRVFGGARCRAQAEFLIADATTLNPTPPELDDDHAAVLDIAGRTAVGGLAALSLRPGETLLVTAAAGGVGVFACQLARRVGVRVLGTASPANHGFLRSIGVEPVTSGDGIVDRLRAAGAIDAVFDGQGRASVEAALALGVPKERINSITDRGFAQEVGVRTDGRATTPTNAILRVAELVASGEIVLPVTPYPFEDAVRAYLDVIGGHGTGKRVLRVVS